jgi:hypothetical protein
MKLLFVNGYTNILLKIHNNLIYYHWPNILPFKSERESMPQTYFLGKGLEHCLFGYIAPISVTALVLGSILIGCSIRYWSRP